MAMITNWDLKTSNNVIYERRSGAAPARQYVVKDLGESFGRSVRFYALGKGNDIGEFEQDGAKKPFSRIEAMTPPMSP